MGFHSATPGDLESYTTAPIATDFEPSFRTDLKAHGCGCAFDPKGRCPVTHLYWDFMARHEALLRRNHRTSGAVAGLARRTPAQRAHDAAVAARVRARLEAGDAAAPTDL